MFPSSTVRSPGRYRGSSAAVEKCAVKRRPSRTPASARTSGTDRREQAPGRVLSEHERAHPGVGAQECHPGSAWQEKAVVVPGIPGQDRVEGRVGVNDNPVSARHVDARAKGGDGDLSLGPAQDVDGGDCLHLLETVGEDQQDLGHDRS